MYYTPNGFADMGTHYSVMMRTSDHGETWQESQMSQVRALIRFGLVI
jgi:hypothetical protein